MGVIFPNESAGYRAARDRLLRQEIALRKQMEAVAAERRALPPGGLVPRDYVFDGLGADGEPEKIRMSELFAPGRNTLIVYHYMFPRHPKDDRAKPAAGETSKLAIEDTPCPSCTALIDQFEGTAAHIEAAGFNFVIVAMTRLERLIGFARERGWHHLRLLSAADNDFNRDYNATAKDGSGVPLTSVFRRDRHGVRHFWSSEMMFAKPEVGQDPRHNGTIEPLWTLMDLTPHGRPAWHEGIDDHGPVRAKPALIAA